MTLLTIPPLEYQGDRTRVSASVLDAFLEDRRLVADWLHDEPPSDEARQAYVRGGFLHALALEPTEVKNRYAFPPRRGEEGLTPDATKLVDRRTTKGKELWEAFDTQVRATGQIAVFPEDEGLALGMLMALKQHDEASRLLWTGGGVNERVLHWTDPETQTPMRARPDRIFLADRVVVDLKSDRDIDPDKVSNLRRWYEYGYHRKAAIYLDGLYEETGENFALAYVFVESTARPRVRVAWLETDSPAVEVGRAEYQDALAAFNRCRASGEWRHRWELDRVVHEVPEWVLRKHEIIAEEIVGAEVVG